MMSPALSAALHWHAAFWPALVVYSLSCTGTGLLVAALLNGGQNKPHAESSWTFLAVSFLLGLGLLGQIWQLFALLDSMTGPVIYTIIGLSAAASLPLAAPHVREVCRLLCALMVAQKSEPLGVRVLLVATVLWIAFTFTCLGREPSGDSLALHLMVAKAAAAAGSVRREWFQLGNEYFGLLGEMTYAALMKIGNEDAAQIFTWLTSIAGAAILLGICERAGIGLRGRVFALAALFTSSSVLIWIGEGKIDLIDTPLGLAALYRLMPRTDGPPSRGDLATAGLLAGFGITAKLMLGYCLVVGGAILLFWGHAQQLFELGPRRLRARITPLLLAGFIFAAFTLLGLGPHFLKNGLLLGQPLAPFTLRPEYAGWLVNEKWYDSETVAHIRAFYPFVLTFGEYFAQYGHLSVIVLAFLPMALFLPRPKSIWRSPLFAVTVVAWVAIFGWALLQGDKVVMRYILPALLLCIPLPAAAAEHVTAAEFKPKFLGSATTATCLATLYMVGSSTYNAYFLPLKTKWIMAGSLTSCAHAYSWCRYMDMVNRLAPPGARVFSATAYRYYLRPDLILCGLPLDPVAFNLGSTVEERWRYFYRQGYTFIVPDPYGSDPRYMSADLAAAPPWVVVTRYQAADPLAPIGIGYDLSKGGPTSPPQRVCRNIDHDNWRVFQADRSSD
jgi:hypothetical protein